MINNRSRNARLLRSCSSLNFRQRLLIFLLIFPLPCVNLCRKKRRHLQVYLVYHDRWKDILISDRTGLSKQKVSTSPQHVSVPVERRCSNALKSYAPAWEISQSFPGRLLVRSVKSEEDLLSFPSIIYIELYHFY